MSWPKWFKRTKDRIVGAPQLQYWEELDLAQQADKALNEQLDAAALNVSEALYPKYHHATCGCPECMRNAFKKAHRQMTDELIDDGIATGAIVFLPEGTKYDKGKPPMELLPPLALEAEARVLEHGRDKYQAWNWAKGITTGRLLGAAIRHIFQYLRGEDIDPDSGLPHLAHAACMIHFALEQQLRPEYGKFDDRHKWGGK